LNRRAGLALRQPRFRQQRGAGSFAAFRRAEISAEERQDIVLKANGEAAGMGAVINLKAIGYAIGVEDFVQFDRVESQAVLIAYIDRNRSILAQVVNVLVDERQRRIGRPFGNDLGPGLAVFPGQVKVERRVFRVGRPRRG